jgi:hypothetical protein
VWIGGVPLHDRFHRLFELSEHKELTMFHMCQLGWGVGGEAWSWRRRLLAWEEELEGELTLLLQNVILLVDKIDRWLWTLESSHEFCVRSAYNYMPLQPPVASTVPASSLWLKEVPLKVVLCAWRLFRDRLPTKDNILHRGIIGNDSRLCVRVCGSTKTLAHLFLLSNHFGFVWYHIYRWIGISTTMPLLVLDHFNQFRDVGGVSKRRRSILQVISFATVWKIWKERNNKLFNGTECSIVQVVDKIKSLTFMWLKAKFANLSLNYHGWWLSPFTLLGIG